jgi:hypothetical protein
VSAPGSRFSPVSMNSPGQPSFETAIVCPTYREARIGCSWLG